MPANRGPARSGVRRRRALPTTPGTEDTQYATLGRVGFEGRFDYRATGTVVNLAARLCSQALGGQILLSPRAYANVSGLVDVERVGPLQLKGFHDPVQAYNVTRLRD